MEQEYESSFIDLGDNTALVCIDHQQYQKIVVPQLIDMTYKVHLGLFEHGFLEDAAVMHDHATEGDRKSWWGMTADGESVVTRVLNAAIRPRGDSASSPVTRKVGQCGRHKPQLTHEPKALSSR